MRNPLALRHTFCTLLLCIFPQAWAQTDAEMSNHYYRFSNAELETVCARMAPTAYIDGLTDGVLLAVPFTGRTYFYQSACYLELARRTANLAWCPKVRERKTMLGNGSSHSPKSKGSASFVFKTIHADFFYLFASNLCLLTALSPAQNPIRVIDHLAHILSLLQIGARK
jgi:hypothetical protein